jgi:protein-L-isoaspartate(D-aspartate) O-methyltransferase
MDKAFTSYQRLIDRLKEKGKIRSESVEQAFRAVPRYLFLPENLKHYACSDETIEIYYYNNNKKIESSALQPSIMATMLELLDLKPGHRVLEIGAGTGYNAALMAEIVGNTGRVVTIDISPRMVEWAQTNLIATDFEKTRVICGDGKLNCSDSAPYDRIIATTAIWDIPFAWYEQLQPNGRMIIPLSIRGTQLLVVFKKVNDYLESIAIDTCKFMKSKGSSCEPHTQVSLNSDFYRINLYISRNCSLDRDVVNRLMEDPSLRSEQLITIREASSIPELEESLCLWLAVNEPNFARLWSGNESNEQWFLGIYKNDCLCLCLIIGAISVIGNEQENSTSKHCGVFVYNYGFDDTLAYRLIDHIHAWDAAGRPNSDNLQIRAYPIQTEYEPDEGETIIEAESSKFIFKWV